MREKFEQCKRMNQKKFSSKCIGEGTTILLENRKPLKIGLIKCVGPFYENEDPEGNFSIFMVREEMVSTRSLSVHHVHSVSGSTE